MTSETYLADCKESVWRDRCFVERFVEQIETAQGPQQIKTAVECNIVGRFARGPRILDVGIGTGRVSLPLLRDGVRLTGVDSSPLMIERCRARAPLGLLRLVQGELQELPFAREAFDTVISVDTFSHHPNWLEHLDELLRVTRSGGRVIVDVGSQDHIEAVARSRGCAPDDLLEHPNSDRSFLRVSAADLRAFAVDRNITLKRLIPCGLALGSLVPNYWLAQSRAYRSGALDRLISWTGVDPLFAAFVDFIERRIVQHQPPTISDRMFAVFERSPEQKQHLDVPWRSPADCDERGAEVWHSEFAAHTAHEPNTAFAASLIAAARPVRLTVRQRAVLPDPLVRELERCERAFDIDDACDSVVSTWRSATSSLAFHGVNLALALDEPLRFAALARLRAEQ